MPTTSYSTYLPLPIDFGRTAPPLPHKPLRTPFPLPWYFPALPPPAALGCHLLPELSLSCLLWKRRWNFGDRGREGVDVLYSFVACLDLLAIDHSSLLRRNTVPTPDRGVSNILLLITVLPYVTQQPFPCHILSLFRRPRRPS